MSPVRKKIIYYIVLTASVLSIMTCILAAASLRINVKLAQVNERHQQLTVIEVIGTLSVVVFVGMLLFQSRLLSSAKDKK